MKFTITLLAFFGTLAVGQNKPTVSILNPEFQPKYQRFYNINDDGIHKGEPTFLAPDEQLSSLCENANGVPRVLKIIEVDDNRNVYFTCLIADDNNDVPTVVPTTKDDTHTNNFPTLNTELGNSDDNTDVPTDVPTTPEDYDEPTTFQPISPTTFEPISPTTHEENIPTQTTESENSDPENKQTFYYVNYRDKVHTPEEVTVYSKSDLPIYCDMEALEEGGWRSLYILENYPDENPRNVYFTCLLVDENTDIIQEIPIPEHTHVKPTTSTETIPTQTTELGYSEPSSTETEILETTLEEQYLQKNQVPTTEPNEESNTQQATVAPYRYIGEGYVYHPSVDAWIKLHVKPESWSDARLRCLHEGSTLASPVDPAMLEVMKGLLGDKVPLAFTGISADYAPGYFYSVEGVSLDDIAASFVPDDAPDFSKDSDACIGMYPSGYLTVLRCNNPKPFICYVKDSDVPIIQSPCGTDPDYVYESRTGKCYKFHTFGRSWSSAFMTCATEGGHLAIINSDVEAKAVVDLVNKYPESSVRSEYPGVTLLGFRDWSEHRTWMTIHGQTLQKAGYARWGSNEPNDPRNEFCGGMFRNGELNDTICGSPMPFVCEKKPAVPPNGTKSDSDGIYTTSVASANK